MAGKRKIIQGSGWIIIKEALDSVTIRISNPACLTDRAYHTAVSSVANVRNIRVILSYVN